MAVSLAKKTDGKSILKVISVTDTAIDWDASFPDPADLADTGTEATGETELPVVSETAKHLEGTALKKHIYERDHDTSKLRYKQDDVPTLFVFAHPHRVDVSRKMREIASTIAADRARGSKDNRDMFTAVFNQFFLGIEQGFSGERQPAQRINGKLTDDFFQSLEDAEVFLELNAAFMSVYNEDRTKDRTLKLGK